MVNAKYLKELSERMVSIKEPKLMESFLKTILTPKELDEVVTRLQILKMLKDGVPQRKIASDLGVSIGTISRGSREIQYGDQKIANFIG
ncbi:transcriptional regulator [Candidatus Peregrinibacteria bacterium]|jgi:TrpR family transcriptional regulator, trp operon repressor|nr:transcriptional regulator [Candidatus Peregrinibacteria bacterium]MBT7736393.1 transcriptional regulator [Candidatus Peregrinibacteria bacterium]